MFLMCVDTLAQHPLASITVFDATALAHGTVLCLPPPIARLDKQFFPHIYS